MVHLSLVVVTLLPFALAQPANYWFSFGDSYTSSGFLTNGTLPSPGNPLGNPPYPGATTVGGTNWIDVDTTVYNNSLVLTYNFAYGGATIDASLVTPYTPTVKSMTDQVNEFLINYASKPSTTQWASKNTLFSVWIGINDIGNSYSNGGDRNAFSDVLLNAEFALIQKLYVPTPLFHNDAGARNFLWISVPPVYRSPLMLANPPSAQSLEKSIIEGFNAKLILQISSFKFRNPGVQTFFWDSYMPFSIILDNPTAYGFVDATSYGGPGDFWGNNYHPSPAAHNIFARAIGQDVLGHTIW